MRERLVAFAISGVLCGAGGALAVHQSGVLNPTTFYFGATVTTLTMLVVGGARSVFGAVLGALGISVVNELLRSVENGAELLGAIHIGEAPGLAGIGLGLILLATMIAMPNGLSARPGGGRAVQVSAAGAPASGSEPRPLRRGPIAAAPGALHAEGISLAFSGIQVLAGIDLSLDPGEALGLIGPNGAGKTTLVNVLSGFQKPDAGTVSLDGADVTARAPERLARLGLARTFQVSLPFSQLCVPRESRRRRDGHGGRQAHGRWPPLPASSTASACASRQPCPPAPCRPAAGACLGSPGRSPPGRATCSSTSPPAGLEPGRARGAGRRSSAAC